MEEIAVEHYCLETLARYSFTRQKLQNRTKHEDPSSYISMIQADQAKHVQIIQISSASSKTWPAY